MKRVHLLPTLILILCLGAAEALVISYIWPRRPNDKERIARLEKLLIEKDSELNRLILERDKHVRQSETAEVAAPANDPTFGRQSSPEKELEQATARAGKAPAAPNVYANNATPPASENTRAGIDPDHLVLVANMLAGKANAKLVKSNGKTSIHYAAGPWNESDPVWELLGTVIDNQVLEKVYLVGDGKTAPTKKTRDDLISFGVPSAKVQVQGQSQGSGEMIIELKRRS